MQSSHPQIPQMGQPQTRNSNPNIPRRMYNLYTIEHLEQIEKKRQAMKTCPVQRIFLLLLGILGWALLSGCGAPATITVENSEGEMALIPAGSFDMIQWDDLKNEARTRTVYVDRFYLDRYEVSNQRYAQCVEAGVCRTPLDDSTFRDVDQPDHPVMFITREMAGTYCAWRDARLPTKAEWDKAAGDELQQTDYYWGAESPICQVGKRLGRSVSDEVQFFPETQPVGSSPPNANGLYEMTGGLWEWVQDETALKQYDNPPQVVSFLRMSRWSGYGPVYQRYMCGFRCASSP